MRKTIGFAALAAGAAMLAACGGDEGAGTPTAEENAQLNEAAEMLDTSPDSLVASDNAELGNGEEESAETGDVAVVNEDAGNAAARNGQ
jgi:predicted small secreted protein